VLVVVLVIDPVFRNVKIDYEDDDEDEEERTYFGIAQPDPTG
jgi:hypothetical protein